MALRGTLKDFGIADILQLIAQQQKSGTLVLKAQDSEVSLGFRDGNIVKVESAFKKKKDLLGNLLVRAELITQQQLDQALEMQKRTLQRIGDVLAAGRVVSEEKLAQMRQLQATETLYRLFTWKSGTYEFEPGEVVLDSEPITPLRAESVLMEGFRMVDEWPLVRKRISNYETTFERLKQLPPATVAGQDGPGLEDPFAADSQSLGQEERLMYELAAPHRDVRKLIDLSCLGEFEACKALCKLVNLEYLRVVPAAGRVRVHDVGRSVPASLINRAARVMLTGGVLAGVAFLAPRLNLHTAPLRRSSTSQYADPAAQRVISTAQLRRIRSALELYRLERGPFPEKLAALVEVGLLSSEDLHFPWRDSYYYRKLQNGDFVLLPPLR
ncbi:MAG TPA: DUF4388 domain-containing protein [Myxococcaceae bacterium]|nr:DUF4388 domain-containing protein [Myxococcaceae bacterium]